VCAGINAICRITESAVPYNSQAFIRIIINNNNINELEVLDNLPEESFDVRIPRIRNRKTDKEVVLSNYQKLQQPLEGDKNLLVKVLNGLSCHKYAEAAQKVPEVFGLSASSISKRFIKASSGKLKQFNARRLEKYDIVAIIIDGKTFAKEQMVIAVGITITGRKVFLGFVQTATENSSVCKKFLQSLIDSGLLYKQGLLFIIDGSKGIRKAITNIFGIYTFIQRCQWHKRENVLSYLQKSQKSSMRKKLQHAYEALQQCRRELSLINQSYWKNSEQKHRWLASALLAIEPNLRRIKGYTALPQLRGALQKTLKLENVDAA